MRFAPTTGIFAALTMLIAVTAATQVHALDDAHWAKADAAIEKAIAYLRTTQQEDGSWKSPGGPAVTGLILRSMLDRPNIATDDPAVSKAIEYILSKVKPDGSIHDGILRNYNTSICIAALARVNDNPEAAKAVKGGQAFLKGLQWNGQMGPDGKVVDESHPYYGGAGYGDSSKGRPDMSNTQLMLEGLYESGLDCNDPVFKRALVFINRCQATDQNDMFGEKIVGRDGGFIYATSINKDTIGIPESKANPEQMDEAVKNGTPVSGLRTYGSMTYAGFKSYIYADLKRDDPRVQAAYNWIKKNYTLDRNPGLPDAQKHQGLYYYYMTKGRALRAWGLTSIDTPEGTRDWANDLIAKLVELQQEDGSWVNGEDRWMEGDPNLVTAYSLIALIDAIR